MFALFLLSVVPDLFWDGFPSFINAFPLRLAPQKVSSAMLNVRTVFTFSRSGPLLRRISEFYQCISFTISASESLFGKVKCSHCFDFSGVGSLLRRISDFYQCFCFAISASESHFGEVKCSHCFYFQSLRISSEADFRLLSILLLCD